MLDNQKHSMILDFSRSVQRSHPRAVGLVLVFFDCGCIRAFSFDAAGDTLGAAKHLGETDFGGRPICSRCREDDGGSRVEDVGLVWFEETRLTEEQKERIENRFFGKAPVTDDFSAGGSGG